MKEYNNKNKKNYKEKKFKQPVIKDSETIRLASIKKQKKAFKAKEQAIRDALNSVDNNTKNNKIVFDDDTIETYKNTTDVIENEKNQLFDSDDDDDDSGPEINFNICEKEKMVTLGNDDRFKISKKLLDDNEEDKVEQAENNNDDNDDDDDDIKNEKNKEMEILQNLLGKPILKKNHVEKKVNTELRYDPLAPNHQEFEQKTEDKVKPISKKKKKAEEAQKKIDEEAKLAVPVSNEVFYSVSDKLSDVLKGKEEFSLLSSFGTVETETNQNEKEWTNFNEGKTQYQLPSNNHFNNHDSTDDENENKTETETDNEKINNIKGFEKLNDSFFFTNKDTRFKDAEEFFKSAAVLKDSFNHIRRDLKQIVKKKIRNNTKKLEPRKKKIQTMKKR